VTRILDHDDKEVFIVKTRTTTKPYTGSLRRSEELTVRGLPDKRRIVTVYQRNPNSKKSRSSGETVATAEELITVGETAQWALMNCSCNLLIRNLNNIIEEEPIFELKGNLGSPLRLLCGKKLQYEVQSPKPETEIAHEFVTLVRYTPQAPYGQATALFNWKSGIIQVTEQESVLLVALLSEVISASLTKHQKRLKYTSTLEAEAKKKVFPSGSDSGRGTLLKSTDQKFKTGSQRRRTGYESGCWGGRWGGRAGAKPISPPSKAELGFLLGAGIMVTYPGGGCEAGCGGGAACGA
jgi:hypothetical protein